jgi:excisionase family DNA binding protein
MAGPDFSDEILQRFRAEYPLVLTTAHVAEMMHSTIGDVRDKVHRGELRAFRWGQQFRFLREEVLEDMKRYTPGEPVPEDEAASDDTGRD